MAEVPDESGLAENNYDVQVTLSDLQDTDNPLSSAKDFKDLNLFVKPPHVASHATPSELHGQPCHSSELSTNRHTGVRASTRVYWP